MIRAYRVVKKEESPTISLDKVKMKDGFLIAIAEDEAIGIIVYDTYKEHYIMITNFEDTFKDGIDYDYYDEDLEKLMYEIKSDYAGVEFNFIRVEQ